jgi:hypothetical protein
MHDRLTPREFLGARPSFAFWAGAVVLLALLIREYFVLATIIDVPIRGDISEYVRYAWNLSHHGVFSMSLPQTTTPVPDAYRSPGFPWLLALCMRLRPQGDGWYALALQMQVLLGTATVWLTMLLARHWLHMGWAVAAGLLLAIWPHHVAATGVLLSEVTFGFALMAGLYAFALAMRTRQRRYIVLCAAAFGYAYLVNPLIALFPPLLALLAWHEIGSSSGLVLIGLFLVPVLAFGLRNLQVEQPTANPPGRAVANFVQGSWPQYHGAWQAMNDGDPGGGQIMVEIDRETSLLHADPRAGMAAVTARFRQFPLYYVRWYALRKPWLLWSWDIQLGPGGVYVLDVKRSPLDIHPLLHLSTATMHALNPMLSLLALGAVASLLPGGLRRRPWAPTAALATAVLALYLTSVHTVFQAEPRYANAYRGIEALLIMSMLQLGVAAWLHRQQQPKHSQDL